MEEVCWRDGGCVMEGWKRCDGGMEEVGWRDGGGVMEAADQLEAPWPCTGPLQASPLPVHGEHRELGGGQGPWGEGVEGVEEVEMMEVMEVKEVRVVREVMRVHREHSEMKRVV